MARISYMSVLLGICLFSGLVFGERSPVRISVPNFEEIVAKFLEKVEVDSLYVADHYTHQELEITENLKNGVVSGIEKKLYHVEKRDKTLFKKLIAKDDILVIDAALQPKKEVISMGAKMLVRYDLHFKGVDFLDEEKCWVFSFKPKKNLPEHSREDRALNRLTGEIWIVQGSLNFKKLSARLLSEVNYALPGLGGGKLQLVDAVIIADSIDGHFMVRSVEVEYRFSARFFFVQIISEHARKRIQYTNYERRKP